MQSTHSERRLKVAVLGAGPAGLAVAIELAKLQFVDWELYEKKPIVSETGGGLSLQPQTWRLLEKNGVAEHLHEGDYFRSNEGHLEQRRNGRTGELLLTTNHPSGVPWNSQSCRLARSKLQSALLKNVDQTHVHLAKRMIGLEHLQDNRVRLSFQDGFVDEVDLLIAADGIRSVVRAFNFPANTVSYNGQKVYRTTVSKSEAEKIDGIPWAPTFWKHVSGLYVYTCPLGDDDFEVTARIRPQSGGKNPVSWGRPYDLRNLLHEYDDFCLPVKQILRLAADGDTQEFALFSGPRLERTVSHGNTALIGDASHPLLGHFGSGAGFALEDAYALTKVLEWGFSRERTLPDILEVFDRIRSPYYDRVYEVLDRFSSVKKLIQAENLALDEEISERIKRVSLASESWMYYYEIDQVVQAALHEAERR